MLKYSVYQRLSQYFTYVLLFFLIIVYLPVLNASSGNGLPLDSLLTPGEKQRIDSILNALSLEEKVQMLYGSGLFTSPGSERFGVRELTYADGPSGVREELNSKSWAPLGWTNDSATFFPTGSALAATWNPDLAYSYGIAIGEEARTRNKDILLAPAVNITRTPLNGRTYEYMSEDPLLNSKLAVGYVNGVQQCGVVACVKHYAANNQETNRGTVNVEMDERTLREIYLPAFKASVVEAKAHGFMTAYNKFRGIYCAENEYLVNQILRKEWGFDGIVMSDWAGTHSTTNSALHGIDVEMGTFKNPRYFAQPLIDSVLSGSVPIEVVNEKVRRVLSVLFFAMKKDVMSKDKQLSTPGHCKTAYNIASQSIILLKNTRNLLPLEISKIKSIAVIGENAMHKFASGGFGAGVKTRYEITPLEGIRSKFGNKVNIMFAKGYKPEYFSNTETRNNRVPKQEIDEVLFNEAKELAKKADFVLLFVGNNREIESEAYDRVNLKLPFAQDSLIKAVTAVNPKTIVIVIAAAPVDLNICNQYAPSILWSWFNGSEGGNALADILTGKINPSGKLPFTIPVKLEDSPAHSLKTFPGENLTTEYKEGILVGYRWFDTKKIKPRFCFGYGLSYTSFEYTDIKTDKVGYTSSDTISISVNLKNTGKVAGSETIQVYVTDLNGNIPKAQKELKAFNKVFLNAGESKKVVLNVKVSDLAYYDEKTLSWIVNPGKYKILVGTSSADYKNSTTLNIK